MAPEKSISLERARELVLADARLARLSTEVVPVPDALDRILAAPVRAEADVPGFDNSAMDGFAVVAGPAGRRLAIGGESRAGAPTRDPLTSNTAIRISTGAALPPGADAVVQVERTAEADGAVTLGVEATPGMNVRRAGEDMRAGEEVLAPGARLGPAALAVTAGAGLARVTCARRPRVAIVTTGDELRDPGEPLSFGDIYDTNSVALAAFARQAGGEVVGQSRAGDDFGATVAAIEAALDGADFVAIAGGVSVGPHDHVKDALAELGVDERFWGVRIKPGRPTWFGVRDRTLVLGLPGNPVSASVIFVLLGRPALAALQGASAPTERLRAVLTEPVRRNADRGEALRVRLRPTADGRLEASQTGPQGSHVSTSLVGADGLALIPAGDGELEAGSPIDVEPI